MKKVFLFISLLTLTWIFLGCEKEKVEPATKEVELTTYNLKNKTLDNLQQNADIVGIMLDLKNKVLANFKTEADMKRELNRLKSKYRYLANTRSDCFQDAWNFGTITTAYLLSEHPETIELVGVEFTEWYLTNLYYEENCE